MDAARRENLRTKAKERWANSKLIAEQFGFLADVVHNSYGRIVKAGLLDAALTGACSLEALQEAMNTPAYKPRIHKESRADATDQLKLAMWFIAKVGGPEQAIKAVKAAAAAVKELEDM